VNYELPRVISPDQQFIKCMYYMLTGFWPEQVYARCLKLTLCPNVIHCRRSGCKAGKELAVFLLLRRQHIADKWEFLSKEIWQQWSRCILVYREFFWLLAKFYWKCMQVLDYRRTKPLLEEWGQKMAVHCGTDPHVPFLTDGKLWKMSCPSGKWQGMTDLWKYWVRWC